MTYSDFLVWTFSTPISYVTVSLFSDVKKTISSLIFITDIYYSLRYKTMYFGFQRDTQIINWGE